MARKHLVIVAIYFPPTISIASQRILAFTKYFDKKLFKITLITLDVGQDYEKPQYLDNVEIIRLKNEKFLKQINLRKNHTFLIHKSGAAINKIIDMLVLDEYSNWTKKAARVLRETHLKQKIDILISSFAPVSSHLAVIQSGLVDDGVKWIADMRDEMSLNPFYSGAKRKYFSKVEQTIFRKAWMLTTTSDKFLENFVLLNSSPTVQFKQIKNGFDFDLPDTFDYNPVFTITHAGTFYSDIKPHTFFKAVSELLSENKIKDIQINLIGAGNAFIIPSDLKTKVNLTGRIVHRKAVEYMLHSDANLIIMPESKKGTLPGKMYEYLGTLKPILSLMDDNEQAADIIKQANAGYIAGFNDINAIKESLLKIYMLWSKKERLSMDLDYIQQFQRKNQVKLLQDYILEANS